MGLFWSSTKPSVSKTEFKEKILRHIEADNWSDEDKELVQMVFEGQLNEAGSQSGIDRAEIEAGIKLLKKSGNISPERLEDLRQRMLDLAR